MVSDLTKIVAMTRAIGGPKLVGIAREMIGQARAADELRQAQAAVSPLLLGLILNRTAQVICRWRLWTCRLRNRLVEGDTCGDGQNQRRGGCRRQIMSPEQARLMLAPLQERLRCGGIKAVSQIKRELKARLQRPLALSSVRDLLHHGWRNLAPVRCYPQSDAAAQA
jgi:hypothetical protein